MVVEVEVKILQGFTKAPGAGDVEEERGEEAASRQSSKGCPLPSPSPSLYRWEGRLGGSPNPLGRRPREELEVNSSLPKR